MMLLNIWSLVGALCTLLFKLRSCEAFIVNDKKRSGHKYCSTRTMLSKKKHHIHRKTLLWMSDEGISPSYNSIKNTDDENSGLMDLQNVVGLSDTELKRIVSRVPEVKTYSAITTKKCLTLLMERLSLSTEEIKKKIVLRLPQVLGYNYIVDIEPSLTLLQQRLALEDDELKSLILKCPQIIGLNFEKDIWPKVISVQSKLGLDNLVDTKKEILQKPALLDVPVRGAAGGKKKTN